MHSGLCRQTLDLCWTIAVMIAERPGKHGRDAEVLQGSPKAGWIRKTTEGGGRRFRRMSGLPGSSVHPIARLNAPAKDGRGRVQRQQLIANAAIFALRRGTHENECVGTLQRGKRLSQPSQWKDGASGK